MHNIFTIKMIVDAKWTIWDGVGRGGDGEVDWALCSVVYSAKMCTCAVKSCAKNNLLLQLGIPTIVSI